MQISVYDTQHTAVQLVCGSANVNPLLLGGSVIQIALVSCSLVETETVVISAFLESSFSKAGQLSTYTAKIAAEQTTNEQNS